MRCGKERSSEGVNGGSLGHNLVDFHMLGSREHAVFVISLSSEVGCLLLAMSFAFLLTVEIQTRNYDFPLATE